MSFLKKLKFWQHDETALGDLKLDEPLPGSTAITPEDKPLPTFEQSMGMQPTNQPMMQPSSPVSLATLEQELRLLTSKVETLIAKMDNMNQRIANLERIASEAQR